MPLIRAIDVPPVIPEGLRIVFSDGTSRTITSADIPANIRNQPVATVEANVNATLASFLTPRGMFGAVHITSVVPLVCRALVSDEPIPDGWWL